jgi:hypothetical protein
MSDLVEMETQQSAAPHIQQKTFGVFMAVGGCWIYNRSIAIYLAMD